MAVSGEKTKKQSKSETVNLHVQLLYFQKFLFYLCIFKKGKQNKKKVIAFGTPLFLKRSLLENKLSRHLKQLSVLIP